MRSLLGCWKKEYTFGNAQWAGAGTDSLSLPSWCWYGPAQPSQSIINIPDLWLCFLWFLHQRKWISKREAYFSSWFLHWGAWCEKMFFALEQNSVETSQCSDRKILCDPPVCGRCTLSWARAVQTQDPWPSSASSWGMRSLFLPQEKGLEGIIGHCPLLPSTGLSLIWAQLHQEGLWEEAVRAQQGKFSSVWLGGWNSQCPVPQDIPRAALPAAELSAWLFKLPGGFSLELGEVLRWEPALQWQQGLSPAGCPGGWSPAGRRELGILPSPLETWCWFWDHAGCQLCLECLGEWCWHRADREDVSPEHTNDIMELGRSSFHFHAMPRVFSQPWGQCPATGGWWEMEPLVVMCVSLPGERLSLQLSPQALSAFVLFNYNQLMVQFRTQLGEIIPLKGDAVRSWALQGVRGRPSSAGSTPHNLLPCLFEEKGSVLAISTCLSVPRSQTPARQKEKADRRGGFTPLESFMFQVSLLTNQIFGLTKGTGKQPRQKQFGKPEDSSLCAGIKATISPTCTAHTGSAMFSQQHQLLLMCPWKTGRDKCFCTLTKKLSVWGWRSPCNNSEQLSEGGEISVLCLYIILINCIFGIT